MGLLLASSSIFAQLTEEGLGVGAWIGRTNPDTDFGTNWDHGAIQASGFLRYPLFGSVDGQLSVSYGTIKAKDEGKGEAFETNLIPMDYRFLIGLTFGKWTPFVYGGAGALFYDIKELPDKSNLASTEKSYGWTAYLPMGGGLDVRITERAALEFVGGYNYTFTDKLNGYESGNGINDGWWAFMAGLSVTGESGEADPDKDGLINKIEKAIGTDRKNPDTDADSLSDGDEFNRYNTNPLNQDTDGDQLMDGEEVLMYDTNPSRSDSDADSLNDYEEIMTHKTDPNNKDSDSDGLSDYAEVTTYKSDPLDPDMDKDELLDGEEVEYKTDFNNPDTDGEGLMDGEEVHNYRTNPLLADTDAGSVDDFTEINRGTNPLDPSDDVVMEIGASIVLEGITFATGKADITPESEEVLNEVLSTLNVYPDMEVEVRGYTDNTGSRSTNMRLSQRRADSVRDWLIERGIDPTRITAKGFGPENPIAPNNTPDGRAKNRRIEFVRMK
jgi:outer membrane protein OmpA-like peptidoglycan-associated protein